MRVFNRDAGKLEPQQLPIRHMPALLFEGEHHAINILLAHQRFQITQAADDSRIDQPHADVFSLLIQKAENFEVEIGARTYFPRERNAGGTGADNQDTFRPGKKEEALGIKQDAPCEDKRHDGGNGQCGNTSTQAHAGSKVIKQGQPHTGHA